MPLKQMELFTNSIDVIKQNLIIKFPRIPDWKIGQVLGEIEKILDDRTDGKYPNSQLKDWTAAALRKLEHPAKRKTGRKKLTGLLQNRSRRIVSRAPDGKSAGANDDTFKD